MLAVGCSSPPALQQQPIWESRIASHSSSSASSAESTPPPWCSLQHRSYTRWSISVSLRKTAVLGTLKSLCVEHQKRNLGGCCSVTTKSGLSGELCNSRDAFCSIPSISREGTHFPFISLRKRGNIFQPIPQSMDIGVLVPAVSIRLFTLPFFTLMESLLSKLSINSSLRPQCFAFVSKLSYRYFVATFRRNTTRVFLSCRTQFKKRNYLEFRNAFLVSNSKVDDVLVLKQCSFSFPFTISHWFDILDFLALSRHRIVAWMEFMCTMYGKSLLFLLMLGYWIQGFRCFPWLAVSYYLKDVLQTDAIALQCLLSTVSLPMVAKPIYGILSDTVHIGGARRRPYLIIASSLQVLSWSLVAIHPVARSSLGIMTAILILGNIGAAIADVVNDTLVAECGQHIANRSKGELQSYAWFALAAGGVIGNLFGSLAISRIRPTAMFSIFFALVSMHLTASYLVKEQSFGVREPKKYCNVTKRREEITWNLCGYLQVIAQQVKKLVEIIKRPEILQLLAWFAASYAVIPTMGGSLFFYHIEYLKVDPAFLGLTKVVGQLGLLAGSIIYNGSLKYFPLRRLVALVQMLLSVCMLSDILLVSRLNLKLGIPDKILVLGASAFVEALSQFKILPFTVLLTRLCPAGSEGTLLAFLMACHCLSSVLSGYLGTALATFLQISADNFSMLPLGILIQSISALVPLLWVSCIPEPSAR